MVAVYLHGAESGVAIRFTRVPPLRSRFSTAVFRYVVERADGSNACYNSSCSISCKVITMFDLPSYYKIALCDLLVDFVYMSDSSIDGLFSRAP